MSSFLEETISGWGKLVKTLILLGVIFIGSYFLITGIISKVFSFMDRIEAVETKDGIPTILLKGRTLSVVDVPAQQIGTGSGVKLRKDKSITITAQGLVSTGSFLPEYLLPDDLKQRPQDLNDLKKRVFLLEGNRDLNIGWRDPDGKLINSVGDIEEIPCLSKRSREMRLNNKDGDWGLLMGFIKKDQENIPEIISDEKRIFRIGKKAVISYDNDQRNYVIEINSDRKTISKTSEDGELFFIINDALVKKVDDLNYPALCGEPTVFEKELREAHKRIYQKISPKENAIGFYYLDNLGNFVVSILIE